jgi:hypothetical protein
VFLEGGNFSREKKDEGRPDHALLLCPNVLLLAESTPRQAAGHPLDKHEE